MKTLGLAVSRLGFFLIAVTGTSAALAESAMFAPERIGKLYGYLGGGGYHPAANAQLSNQEGRFGIAGGLGYRYSSALAREADFLDGYQEFDTPATILPAGYGTFFQGTVDPRATLNTMGVAATARCIYPLGRLEPYVGGGIGLYSIELRATGQQLGIPMDFTYNSTELGWHALAGADYYITKMTSLGVEYRMRKVSTNLGNVVPGSVDAGGSFVSLILRSAI